MIYVKLEGHNYRYEIENIIRIFYNNEDITFVEQTLQPPENNGGIFLFSGIVRKEMHEVLKSYIYAGSDYKAAEMSVTECIGAVPDLSPEKAIKKGLQRQLFILLQEKTRMVPPWGMLTGIRPAKLVHEMLERNLDNASIMKRLQQYYMVSPEKSALLYSVTQAEKSILEKSRKNSIGIYIGMPFCPSRCLYCSFTSNPISRYKKSVEAYIDALKVEIDGVSKIIKDRDFEIESVYFGGGTPTSIDSNSLKLLLEYIDNSFDLSNIREYTIEAGRPDSINSEKLEIIKNSRADRISINPQTMNDETLRSIGRNHTAEDIVSAFNLARNIGFCNINMDIIIGLPGENEKMFENTLERLEILGPESLTVHTMAVKRASRLKEENRQYSLTNGNVAAEMVGMAQKYSERMGMHPYYLYRQKNMLGNLENVGYCKPGYESLYNVQIMEEKQTIIALGAGAITKVVYSNENRLERAFNVKSVEEYVNRVDEMLERKRTLLY